MSFLSNFNILIGILLGPTDLLESNERKTLRDINRKVFNSYNSFYAYPCIFNAILVGIKIMIEVVSFALLQNCRKLVSVVFIFLMIFFFYLRIFCSYELFY